MANIIRVSGTKVVTPYGPTTIQSPTGSIVLDSTVTNATGNLAVDQNATVALQLTVGPNINSTNVPSAVSLVPQILLNADQTANVDNPTHVPFDITNTYPFGNSDPTGEQGFAERVVGALYVPGGVGIEKDLNVGGFIYGRVAKATTSLELVVTTTNVDQIFYPVFTSDVTGINGTELFGDNVGTDSPSPYQGLTYNPATGKLHTDRMYVASADISTGTYDSNALYVAGGAGIVKDVQIGGNLNVGLTVHSDSMYPNADNMYTIGTSTTNWMSAYMETIYSKLVTTNQGGLNIAPQGGGIGGYPQTTITGDILVQGKNPIGTAPVVTNVLYVTMDGDDTNDGRAMDASRACRTISGAIKSPYYQPGTQIRVSPGHYLENNPILLKPYTTVMGSDLRTTSVEPINKTQDLFHVQSGCYLAFMQMTNGRSGLLPGQYAIGYNRGAYATAFPPDGDANGNPIDLFHSPYIQNCTNQSGPWMLDGAMFVPDYTVQVPAAVGIGSWEAGQDSIVVKVQPNLSVVTVPNNSGFDTTPSLNYFYVDQVSWEASGVFVTGDYTSVRAGVVIDDPKFPAKTEILSVEGPTTDPTSGLSYYIIFTSQNQTSNVSQGNSVTFSIPGGPITTGMYINAGAQNSGFYNARSLLLANEPFLQEQTVAFINKTFNSGSFVYNEATCLRDVGLIIDGIGTDMLNGSTSESIFTGIQYYAQSGYTGNIPSEITATITAIEYIQGQAVGIATAAGGATVGTIVDNDFNVLLNILQNGTVGVTDRIASNGLPSTDPNIMLAFDRLTDPDTVSALSSATLAYITANNLVSPFSYNTATCYRDTGLIVDAVAQDILFGGYSQSTFAAIQYWSQSGYTGSIGSEITQTVAAIEYLKSLAQQAVRNTLITGYQTSVHQVISLTPATSAEASIIGADFDVITNILNNGVAGVTDAIVPNGLTISTSTNISNAFAILEANKDYFVAEVIAFITTTYLGFAYNQATCSRDVGYIIDSVGFDLLYPNASGPANRQAIQSGVYYYSYNDTSVINTPTNEIPQTTAAYNYIKSILPSIVQGIPLTSPYQTAVPQILTNTSTEYVALMAGLKVDNITNIINNGPGVVTEKTSIGLVPSTDANVVRGALALEDNRAFIQAEVIAYVNNQFAAGYNQATCYRDVSYILTSIAFDLMYPNAGGPANRQAIKAGVYYYNYNNSNPTSVIPNEIPQTSAAYYFIKSIVSNIVTATPILNPYQQAVPQETNLPPATTHEGETLMANLDVIIDIIRNGPSSVAAKIPMNVSNPGLNQVIINAYNLLEANKSFIQAEVSAYISATLNNFSYNQAKSFRDTGILVENVAYDITFGGNQKSVESGSAYYNGVVSVIPGQEVQCITAIDYLNQLCQKIVTNTTCTDLLLNTSTNITSAQYKQVINTALTGGNIAINSINDRFNIITNIIANGQSAAPATYVAAGPDAAYASAEILLQLNRGFIQENTINYINYNLCQKPFPFNQLKCSRDTGLIVDSIALDLLYPTPGNSQSTFSALQYWAQSSYTGQIPAEINQTVDAVKYLQTLAVKVVQNITTATDAIVGITRYQNTVTQVTNIEAATSIEATFIKNDFNVILEILSGNNKGWTDKIVPNGLASDRQSIANAVALLQANTPYLQAEIVAYIAATNPGFVYNVDTCKRDVGYIINSVCFDLQHGGNRQAVQAGLYYYGVDASATSIHGQETQTAAALNRLAAILPNLLTNLPVTTTPRGPIAQNAIADQVTNLPPATLAEVSALTTIIATLTNIILNGPSVAAPKVPISLTASTTATVLNAYNILEANRAFIQAEILNYIEHTYNPNAFKYNEFYCYRDLGLIIDAVSQDVLLNGNSKSLEAGLSYWNQGYSYVTGQETTTTMAIKYARDIALQVISNQPVAVVTGTISTQVINPFYSYADSYMPRQAVSRNFDIITNIILNGPALAPPVYQGGGISLATGALADDVKIAPEVTSVSNLSDGSVLVGLSTSTIGFGTDVTLYFGDVYVIPKQDNEVEALSLEYTGNANTWNIRKLDPIGSMGGSLVDGAVISARSPIQSFVYDAFTQVNQGGRGVHVTNNGYAQLVSVFTIFCSVGVQVDNGGIASIVNSNDNFGDICLLAKGYGTRAFSGHLYNPPFKAYPNSPDPVTGLNQYFPAGYWPKGGEVEVFVPDTANRPHISLVMEVVPPLGYKNYEGFPGFLNAAPNTGTLTTGTITLTGISTDGIAIGNTVYITDQYNSTHGSDGNLYAQTGTVVTDLGYQSITLSLPLTSGGVDPTYGAGNTNYFNLYFCGNAYYTVQSSTVAENPDNTGTNILSAGNGLVIDETNACVSAIRYLNTLTDLIINNTVIPTVDLYQNRVGYTGTTYTQVTNALVSNGGAAQTFIDLDFATIVNIITAPTITAAQNVIPSKLISTTGTIPSGASSAITLIQSNANFLAAEIQAYIQFAFPSVYNDQQTLNGSTELANKSYNPQKSIRDVGLILQRLIYDLETGGNYNAVYTGLSYWSRNGTHHIVQLGENVTDSSLFPDGATVNFYQRSYISASGYVFEYVGAGTNYGALPQVGQADPVTGKEVVQLDGGKVFYTSTDQNGDFNIGPGLTISQATGVLSGRTFTRSLFASLTPFVLAIT